MFNYVALFVEVAKAHSFRQAGEVLGISSSTVSRRIAELEREFGLPLFNRTTRLVELTEAGEVYFESCQRMAEEERLVREHLANKLLQPRGILRIAAPVSFSLQAMTEIIPEFSRRYPEVIVDLDLTMRIVDLFTEPYDVAIQSTEPKEQDVVARKFAQTPIALYASPAYLAARGVPQQPQDLREHDFLRQHSNQIQLWPVTGGDFVVIDIKEKVIANNPEMLNRLAMKDMGIVIAGELPAAALVAENKLVRVLPDWTPGILTFHAVTVSRNVPARVRVFIDFLVERFQARSRKE